MPSIQVGLQSHRIGVDTWDLSDVVLPPCLRASGREELCLDEEGVLVGPEAILRGRILIEALEVGDHHVHALALVDGRLVVGKAPARDGHLEMDLAGEPAFEVGPEAKGTIRL